MLRFVQLVVAKQSEFDNLEAELQEARDLLKSYATMLRQQQALINNKSRLRSKWSALLNMLWMLMIGVMIGGLAIPHHYDRPSLAPDLPACIGQARYEHPVKGNQYQELVNALYSCEVYS